MSMESEMRANFGGFWNSLILLFVVIVCMRFASLEQVGKVWQKEFYVASICF